jgi:hypothetical protein
MKERQRERKKERKKKKRKKERKNREDRFHSQRRHEEEKLRAGLKLVMTPSIRFGTR